MQGWSPVCDGTLRLTLPRRQKVLYYPKTGTVLFGSCCPLLARSVAPKETIPCYYNDPLVCWLNRLFSRQ